MFAGPFDVDHRVLRDNATIVFYFDVELVVWKDASPELEDLRETIRAQPVLDIAADVRLQDNRFVSAGEPAAIDKIFHHVTNLGHVSMRRNGIAIGEDETRKSVWVLFEDVSKSGEFHERSIFLLKNIVKMEPVRPGPALLRRSPAEPGP